ncbi:hypothetical protein HRbin40_01027 [bacterium HR40]|nr:hypothetical protein HRbin40_01027 [bacterium HR40]
MRDDDVRTAFELLLEIIEEVANDFQEEGAEALVSGRYEEARRAIADAERVAELRRKIKDLQKEWAAFRKGRSLPEKAAGRASAPRLPKGLRTPEDHFRRPILEALVELGGRASSGEVLDKVEEKMAQVLNAYDREPLPRSPQFIRWRNTASWCRMSLVREGLMKADSPHGIWEISDAGQRWLRAQPEVREGSRSHDDL